MWELTLPVLLAGMAAALGGGFIDAIAGGGGLVTMPWGPTKSAPVWARAWPWATLPAAVWCSGA